MDLEPSPNFEVGVVRRHLFDVCVVLNTIFRTKCTSIGVCYYID